MLKRVKFKMQKQIDKITPNQASMGVVISLILITIILALTQIVKMNFIIAVVLGVFAVILFIVYIICMIRLDSGKK